MTTPEVEARTAGRSRACSSGRRFPIGCGLRIFVLFLTVVVSSEAIWVVNRFLSVRYIIWDYFIEKYT